MGPGHQKAKYNQRLGGIVARHAVLSDIAEIDHEHVSAVDRFNIAAAAGRFVALPCAFEEDNCGLNPPPH
jgi:hypothetical protein